MDKLLPRLIKSKTEKTQITKIRNEKAYITTELTVIKGNMINSSMSANQTTQIKW